MSELLNSYAKVAGQDVIDHIKQLAHGLSGAKVVHVNSTREGGGVAEILNKLIPLMQSLGLDVKWEIIEGGEDFYKCTKAFHNGLQGQNLIVPDQLLRVFEETNRDQAEILRPALSEADFVFIHDPQPAPLLSLFPERKGKWLWRCHIDVSHPVRSVWKYLREFVKEYDASIFSMPEFAQPIQHPQYLIAPSIDPLSEKNEELSEDEVNAVFNQFGLDPELPMVLQVSRFDRFKDPLGVIEAYRIVRNHIKLQLVLAGGGATDDPEGEIVLKEVRQAAQGDPNIHILVLPSDAHRTINALQRASDIVLQKSIKEGFGLTVGEAMWKGKPVIGGDAGGIRIQIADHYTGFLVNTPEGAALRIRFLLHRRALLEEMGQRAKRSVRENYLITRHLRDYLSVMIAVKNGGADRIEVGF